ncbi:MAG: metalloregulator ArsR/SmtB family transcription factor [Candidatus Saccharimonadales bacterium]
MEKLDKFYALSAPIRREIIALLSEGEQLTATAIAESFRVSPSAISQHLKVLLNTDIVQMHKQAQQRIYQLNSTAIQELESWAGEIVAQLDKVGQAVESQVPKSSSKEATK